jgi:hypothetical protein
VGGGGVLVVSRGVHGADGPLPASKYPNRVGVPVMCPKLDAGLRQNNVPSMKRVLVPGNPTTLVVCSGDTGAVIKNVKKITEAPASSSERVTPSIPSATL